MASTDGAHITLTRAFPADMEDRLSELFQVTRRVEDDQMTREALLTAARASDVLVCTLGDRLDADFFASCGDRLRLVASFGAGVDHIDVDAAHERGITVTNTPSVLAEDAADMAMALILAVPRRLVEGVMALQGDNFKGWSPLWMLGHSIRGRKLGIVGLGRVGEAVARRAPAFGLEVHYHNRHRINPHMEKELHATWWENLDDMLAAVDIVSVNCPFTEETRGLLSRQRLERLSPDAFLINASRAGIVDEEALMDLIEAGRIAGAGLDVSSTDPTLVSRYLAAKNVVRLPHMASATVEARRDMGQRLVINVKMFLDGHKPPDRVIPGIS